MRIYVATAALQGLLAAHPLLEAHPNYETEALVQRAVSLADALFAELNKKHSVEP